MLREDQVRPYVVVDIEPSHVRPMVDFVVRNLGQTAARDVRITTDPILQTTNDDRDPQYALKNSVIMTQGIPMPPGREIRSFFDSMPELTESDLPMRYDGTVTYAASRGAKPYRDDFIVDLNVHAGLMYLDQKGVHHTAKALEVIAQRLGKWTEGHSGIRVFVQDRPSWAWQSGRLRRHPQPSVRRVQEWIDEARKRLGRDPITWNPHLRRNQRRRAESVKRREAAGS